MATTTQDVDFPEPKAKSEFVGFRLDKDTQDALDALARDVGGNRSAVLRRLVRQASKVRIPPQERQSAL